MENITEIFSSDKNYRLKFYDAIEPKMGMTVSKFSLHNNTLKEKFKFPRMLTSGYKGHSVSWSENSQYCSLSIIIPFNSFVVIDINNRLFSILKFHNVWNLRCKCANDTIEVEFPTNQIPEKKESNNSPTQIFKNKLIFKFPDLKWVELEKRFIFNDLESEYEFLDT
ncbi:MAG: hypothetical protein V4642_16320 [Bacteroidota bacterium]